MTTLNHQGKPSKKAVSPVSKNTAWPGRLTVT
jgi:hypothetical protein